MSNLYSKEIIEHYKNPRNFKKLDKPNHSGKAINSVCGDEIYFEISEKDGKVDELGFQGIGCAICVGAMSMLSEKIKDSSVDELKELSERSVLDLVGMEPDSPRVKCATLSVEAIHNALK
jgi:nitrogen fixation NifU-like protein